MLEEGEETFILLLFVSFSCETVKISISILTTRTPPLMMDY